MPNGDDKLIPRARLAQVLKQKYPQLSSYDDSRVVEEFVRRHPEYESRLESRPFPEPPPGPTSMRAHTWKDTAKETALTVGEALPAAGAVAGTALAPEAAPLWTLLAAAGLGGAAGTAGKQAVSRAVGQPDPGLGKRLEEMGTGGLEQIFAELSGRVTSGVAGKAFGQGSRVLRQPEDRAVADISKRYGLNLTPAEIEKRGLRESLQKSAEGSILGRATIQEAKGRTFVAAQKAVDEALAKLTAPNSPLAAGHNLQAALKDSNEIFHQVGRRLYADVDRDGGGVLVNLKPLKDWAQGVLKGPAGQAAQYAPHMAKMTAAERAILGDAQNIPDLAPFSVAHEIRKRLLAIGPETTEMMPGVGKAMAKKAAGIVTDAMEGAGSGLKGAKAVNAWNAARSFWRDGAEIFEGGLVQKLVEEQPSLLVRALKTPEDVRLVKTALRDYSFKYGTYGQRQLAAQSWNQLRERYVRDVLLGGDQMTTRVGGTTSGEPLQKLASNLRAAPPETLRELFGGDRQGVGTYTVLREIGQAMERVNKMPAPTEIGFFRLMRFGGIEEYEWMLSKALAHPKTARMLLYAIRQAPRSIEVAADMMRKVQEETRRQEERVQ